MISQSHWLGSSRGAGPSASVDYMTGLTPSARTLSELEEIKEIKEIKEHKNFPEMGDGAADG